MAPDIGDVSRFGLVLADLQNDFLHPQGAYGRAGCTAAAIAALPARIKPLADAVRAAGGWVISTHFTLVPGRNGEPLIAPHLKSIRPFLGKGDFLPGAWGHALVDDLAPADFAIEKVAYSAFYMSRMEWLLRELGIATLAFCGIVTNGGVAATLRDAHVRSFDTILLEDGCATFSDDLHRASVISLGSVAHVMRCAELADRFRDRG
jgi:ureidoacrylate peracid hydrolase